MTCNLNGEHSPIWIAILTLVCLNPVVFAWPLPGFGWQHWHWAVSGQAGWVGLGNERGDWSGYSLCLSTVLFVHSLCLWDWTYWLCKSPLKNDSVREDCIWWGHLRVGGAQTSKHQDWSMVTNCRYHCWGLHYRWWIGNAAIVTFWTGSEDLNLELGNISIYLFNVFSLLYNFFKGQNHSISNSQQWIQGCEIIPRLVYKPSTMILANN